MQAQGALNTMKAVGFCLADCFVLWIFYKYVLYCVCVILMHGRVFTLCLMTVEC